MNWQGGRQLASMTKGSDTLSFAYNESGLRTSKTVNGVTRSYVWQGSKLAADITDAYALYFHYDSAGDVIGFTRTANGADAEYFYVKNLQGDILKVITATGTEAATYTYDAWGKLLTSTGDMADVNPLRYNGTTWEEVKKLYQYDTGLSSTAKGDTRCIAVKEGVFVTFIYNVIPDISRIDYYSDEEIFCTDDIVRDHDLVWTIKPLLTIDKNW